MATSNFDQMCVMVSKFNYLFGVINYNYNPLDTNTFTDLFNPESMQFDPKQIKVIALIELWNIHIGTSQFGKITNECKRQSMFTP